MSDPPLFPNSIGSNDLDFITADDQDILDLTGSVPVDGTLIVSLTTLDSDGNGHDGTVTWFDDTGAQTGQLLFENIETISPAASTPAPNPAPCFTRNHGMMPIRWIGTRKLAAKFLQVDQSICRKTGGVVEYIHPMFDTHKVIAAEGAFSESFHPGHVGLNGFDAQTRDEKLSLFPELRTATEAGFGPAARRTLIAKEAALLKPM